MFVMFPESNATLLQGGKNYLFERGILTFHCCHHSASDGGSNYIHPFNIEPIVPNTSHNLQPFNDLPRRSNANKIVIDTQCTSMLFFFVFAYAEFRSFHAVYPALLGEPRPPSFPPAGRVPARSESAARRAHFAQFQCNISPFRINTCKSVSKQRALSPFRINTYEKHAGWGRGEFSTFKRSDVSTRNYGTIGTTSVEGRSLS